MGADLIVEPIGMAGHWIDIAQVRRIAQIHSLRRLSELSSGHEVSHSRHPDGADDPVVYEVFEWTTGSTPTDLLCAVTVLYSNPDQELPFHTRGHFHRDPDGGELVVGLEGAGRLDLLSRQGDVQQVPIEPLAWAQVPPGWAHRVTNLGPVPMVFLSSCSAVVGHDYEGLPKEPWADDSFGRDT